MNWTETGGSVILLPQILRRIADPIQAFRFIGVADGVVPPPSGRFRDGSRQRAEVSEKLNESLAKFVHWFIKNPVPRFTAK